jgi:hypothetical protein
MYDFTFIHQKTVQTIFLASKGNQTRNILKINLHLYVIKN